MNLTTIIIAAVCVFVGLVVGSLLTYKLSPQEKKRRALEDQVKQKEDELKIYQRDVAEHLIKSSQLIGEMNRNHREISEQLATSAMLLTSQDVSRKVQAAAFAGLGSDNPPRILSSVAPEPPKDYAPSVPGGVLSENYGLSDIKQDKASLANIEPHTSDNFAEESEEEDPTLNIS